MDYILKDSKNPKSDLHLAFDIGHSSLGWAVLRDSQELTNETGGALQIAGTGVVTFPADDCLASQRRDKRRQRRHVRATRQRIERLAIVVHHLLKGSADKEHRDFARHLWQVYVETKPGQRSAAELCGAEADQRFKPHPAPWLLAARVLCAAYAQSKGSGDATQTREVPRLSWPELWCVLRWYAHNRGYEHFADDRDGEENVRKVQEAEALMADQPVTQTMAETVVKKLYENALTKFGGKNWPTLKKIIFSDQIACNYARMTRYQGPEAPAYSREVVVAEVQKILSTQSHLESCDGALIQVLLEDWSALNGAPFANDLYLTQEEAAKLHDSGSEPAVRLKVPSRRSIPDDRAREARAQQVIAAREKLTCGKLCLPRRYEGGVLFGRLKPRFHNRIISTCPVTYKREYLRLIEAGATDEKADHTARKLAKAPLKTCQEFLQYRWARNILANIKVDRVDGVIAAPLTKEERAKLNAKMQERGFYTRKELEEDVKALPGVTDSNVESMFQNTEEVEESLAVDLVKQFIGKNALCLKFWDAAKEAQAFAMSRLRRGKRLTLADIQKRLATVAPESLAGFQAALERIVADEQADYDAKAAKAAASKRRKKKGAPPPRPTLELILSRPLPFKLPGGRAPYHRKVLTQVVKEVMAGFDPTKPAKRPDMDSYKAAKAEDKEMDGCLVGVSELSKFRLGERMSSERWLAEQTNNHLVRHRLLILEKLTREIIKAPQYAYGDKNRIAGVTIECARDLITFSGKTKAEIGGANSPSTMLQSIMEQHYRVKEHLEAMLEREGKGHLIDGELIWKAKVADDLNWRCPYTGETICPLGLALGQFDKDHIIPKSRKLTDAMEAVVITYKQINRLKGNRTGWEFVNEFAGKTLDGMSKPILPIKRYEKFVENLRTHFSGGRTAAKAPETNEEEEGEAKVGTSTKINPMYLPHTDRLHPDYKRRKKRKMLMMVKKYDPKKHEFAPRDLTITSHLNRLAQQSLMRVCDHLQPHEFISIPGSVTGSVRDCKGWSLLRLLGHEKVCGNEALRPVPKFKPGTKEIEVDEQTGEPRMIWIAKPKAEIRKITHLHHALDACLLAFLGRLLPKDGRLWTLISLQELSAEEKAEFEALAEKHYWQGWRYRDYFTVAKIPDTEMQRKPDAERCWRIQGTEGDAHKKTMHAMRQSIVAALAEKRVVQHMPSDRSGLALDETVYRVATPGEAGEAGRLIQELIDRRANELNEMKSAFAQTRAEIEAMPVRPKDDGEKQKKKGLQDTAKELKKEIDRREVERSRMTSGDFIWTLNYVARKKADNNDCDLVKAIKEWDKAQKSRSASIPDGGEEIAAQSTEPKQDGKKAKREKKSPPAVLGYTDAYEKIPTRYLIKYSLTARDKLIGLSPSNPEAGGRLLAVKAAKEINENYACALLEHVPVSHAPGLLEQGAEVCMSPDQRKVYVLIIPRHRVSARLSELQSLNCGEDNVPRKLRLIRKGALVGTKGDRLQGRRWRVASVKKTEAFGIALDLRTADGCEVVKQNQKIEDLIHSGLTIENPPLIGVAAA